MKTILQYSNNRVSDGAFQQQYSNPSTSPNHLSLCMMSFSGMPIGVMPFCVMPIALCYLSMMPFCIMPIYTMPLLLM